MVIAQDAVQDQALPVRHCKPCAGTMSRWNCMYQLRSGMDIHVGAWLKHKACALRLLAVELTLDE